MPTHPKDGKLLYHLTSIKNIETILSNGLRARDELLSYAEIIEDEMFDNVADDEIIAGRDNKGLGKMVPFHFFAKNPFAGAVQKKHKDKTFAYITVRRAFAKNNNFKILPKHPLSTEHYELMAYDEGFDCVDWDLMGKRDYTDAECKSVCMAECLSSKLVLPGDFHCIYVPDQETLENINRLKAEIIPDVFIFIEKRETLFIK